MKRIICLFCVFLLFINGCATARLQKSIKEAQNEELILSEYTDSFLKDGKLHIGYVACDSSKKIRINCVATYELDKFKKFINSKNISSIAPPEILPDIEENTFIPKDAGGTDIPVYFIDKQSINKTDCCKTYYQSFLDSAGIENLNTPCIYAIYEQNDKKDDTALKVFNNFDILFIWKDNVSNSENGSTKTKYLELNPPVIKNPDRIKEYSLKSLYPFAIIIDIPIMVFSYIALLTAYYIGGYRG